MSLNVTDTHGKLGRPSTRLRRPVYTNDLKKGLTQEDVVKKYGFTQGQVAKKLGLLDTEESELMVFQKVLSPIVDNTKSNESIIVPRETKSIYRPTGS